MSKDQSRKAATFGLPLMGDLKKVLILREKQPIQVGGSLQKHVVVDLTSFVFLAGQYIDTAAAQSFSNGSGHMHIHVDFERH